MPARRACLTTHLPLVNGRRPERAEVVHHHRHAVDRRRAQRAAGGLGAQHAAEAAALLLLCLLLAAARAALLPCCRARRGLLAGELRLRLRRRRRRRTRRQRLVNRLQRPALRALYARRALQLAGLQQLRHMRRVLVQVLQQPREGRGGNHCCRLHPGTKRTGSELAAPAPCRPAGDRRAGRSKGAGGGGSHLPVLATLLTHCAGRLVRPAAHHCTAAGLEGEAEIAWHAIGARKRSIVGRRELKCLLCLGSSRMMASSSLSLQTPLILPLL